MLWQAPAGHAGAKEVEGSTRIATNTETRVAARAAIVNDQG
jgi:hypothetical protein